MTITRDIPFVDPVIDNNEAEMVQEVIKSKWLVEGKYSRELEKRFSEFVGTKHASITSSGTTALILAFNAIGIKPGDEVITTPFTFIASSNSILHSGGVPIFVDIDPRTWNIDPEQIRKAITPKTKAILPVHIFGLPANMPEIMEIARENDLYVIEDAAQAHGARINGKHVGSFGDIGCFSFYATKNMITGEGGMVVTNNEELKELIDSYKNHGRSKKGGYAHYRIGYNYRTTDIIAAIGLAQLKKLPNLLEARKTNAEYLRKIIDETPMFQRQEIPEGYTHGNYILALKTETPDIVDKAIQYLKEEKVLARRIYHTLSYEQPAYHNIESWNWSVAVKFPDYSKTALPIAEDVSKTHFEVPIVPSLTREEREHIGERIQRFKA